MIKTTLYLLFISGLASAQQPSILVAGMEVELGMDRESIFDMINYDLYYDLLDENENVMIARHSDDQPAGIIYFENDKVIKVEKDWGSAYHSNVAKVFKILWNVFRQYGAETELLKVAAVEKFTPKGEKYSLKFYIDEFHYVFVNLQHKVFIFEVLEKPAGL